MADWLSAFKYAARGLRRQPTFLAVSLLTLALGIGATTAIFSVIKAVVLNPLPYDAPDRLAVLWEVNPEGNQERVSVPTFDDWTREARTLQGTAAYRQVDFSYAGKGDPINVPGLRATPGLFAVLRADAALGRTFVADEAVVGADRVVVLSHGFWSRVLGADPRVVGTTIPLDAVPFTVVGVMPPGFEFPTATTVEVWTPLAFDPKDIHGASRRARSLTVVARLADGASMAQAQEEVGVLAARIASAHPDSNKSWSARVVAAHEQLVAASRPALLVLMGAVAFLLLIVCANMANLLLARLSSRRREIAVRGALGAGRWEVARPILAEAILLAAGGGLLGLLVAAGGLRVLSALPEAQLPRLDRLQLDSGVLAFATVISLAVALAFGMLPAVRAGRDLRQRMHDASGTMGSAYASRALSALVVIEVALALVLLVGAGLMTRSFQKLLQVSPGFDATNLVAARVLLPTTKYSQRPARGAFLRGCPRAPAPCPRRHRRLGGVGDAAAQCRRGQRAAVHGGRATAAAHRGSAGRRPDRRTRLLPDDAHPAARGPSPRRAGRRGRAAHQPDQPDDGPSLLSRPQSARPDHPEPARQERGGGRGRRRPQPGARERAEEAGLPADAAEPVGRHGAGGAHRARPGRPGRRPSSG